MTKIAMLHTGIRGDEKLIIQAAQNLGVDLEPIDVRKMIFDPRSIEELRKFDVFLERCVSSVRGNSAIEFLDNLGLKVVNSKEIMNICNDKFQTATVLDNAKVPNLRSILVFSESSAKEAVRDLGGYPVVIKSREGSWGRMVSKVNDDDALEALIEYRGYFGADGKATVVQEFIEKKEGRDIRAFVIGGECIAAIYRTSDHWITNTARGGKATNCPITPEIAKICKDASDAVGGGLLALDLFETTDDRILVNEINHTMEFKNSEAPTGVSISEEIVKFCVR